MTNIEYIARLRVSPKFKFGARPPENCHLLFLSVLANWMRRKVEAKAHLRRKFQAILIGCNDYTSMIQLCPVNQGFQCKKQVLRLILLEVLRQCKILDNMLKRSEFRSQKELKLEIYRFRIP